MVDRDLRVLVWNRPRRGPLGAARRRGGRQHLLNLDIGLPLEQLKPLLRDVLEGEQPGEVQEVVLPALNRRGRSLDVRVTATPLRRLGNGVTGAIIVVDQDPATSARDDVTS